MAEFNRSFDGNFGHRDNMKAEHYIDINGPNPPGFKLKIGTPSIDYTHRNVTPVPNTLGGLCWLLFVASVVFICLWVIVKLVMAVWPWLIALTLAGAIYKLARRMAKRKG